MADVLPAALALVAVLCVVGGLGGLLWYRQRTLSRRVASFSCLLRDAAPEGPWRAGVAQYGAGRLMWWTSLSLSPRPARTWSRIRLDLLERTPLDQADELGRPLLQVRCRHLEEVFDLIDSAPACAGLVSWLESAPRQVRRLH